MCAEILKCAEVAKPFLEGVARSRSGGHEAVVRTIAQCGLSGTVAFSMLGNPVLKRREGRRQLDTLQ